MKNILHLLLIIVLLLSCNIKSENKTDHTSEKSLPVFDLAKQINANVLDTFTWNSIQKKVTFIPLETNESSLLTESISLEYIDDRIILIVDYMTNNILIFDNEGHLLHAFNHTGKGPGEYIYLTHVFYNPTDSSIGVFDNGNQQLIFYNLKGEHIKSFPTKNKFDGNIIYSGKQKYIVKECSGSYQIGIYDKSLELVQEYLPYNPNYSESIKGILTTTVCKSKTNDKCIYNTLIGDTVYDFSGEKYEPLFILKKGKYAFPESEMENVFRFETTRITPYLKDFRIEVTSNLALIRYVFNGAIYAEVLDLDKEEFISHIKMEENYSEIIPYKLSSENIIRIFPKFITQHQLVFLIPAIDLMDDIKGLKEDDNPVLMILDI